MLPASHDVKCLTCGREVGEIVQRRFVRHACAEPPRSAGGRARCCLKRPHHVGGAVA